MLQQSLLEKDPDLVRALLNRIRHHAAHPNPGQQQGAATEDNEHGHVEGGWRDRSYRDFEEVCVGLECNYLLRMRAVTHVDIARAQPAMSCHGIVRCTVRETIAATDTSGAAQSDPI